MKRAFFTSCVECGSDKPNHSGVCGNCAPLYLNEPMIDDTCSCLQCREGLTHIMPCSKEGGDE